MRVLGPAVTGPRARPFCAAGGARADLGAAAGDGPGCGQGHAVSACVPGVSEGGWEGGGWRRGVRGAEHASVGCVLAFAASAVMLGRPARPRLAQPRPWHPFAPADTRQPPIAHRDLKSANLLVHADWQVKVGVCRDQGWPPRPHLPPLPVPAAFRRRWLPPRLKVCTCCYSSPPPSGRRLQPVSRHRRQHHRQHGEPPCTRQRRSTHAHASATAAHGASRWPHQAHCHRSTRCLALAQVVMTNPRLLAPEVVAGAPGQLAAGEASQWGGGGAAG